MHSAKQSQSIFVLAPFLVKNVICGPVLSTHRVSTCNVVSHAKRLFLVGVENLYEQMLVNLVIGTHDQSINEILS